MKLYYVPQTRSSRPRWMLEELGVPYELVRLDPSKGEHQTPEYKSVHPQGKVPALDAGDGPMIESAAMVVWLADRHLDKGFAPALSSPERQKYLQWIFYSVASLEPYLSELHAHSKNLPEEKRQPAMVARCKELLPGLLQPLEEALAGKEWLVGGSFSAADLIVGANLLWAKRLVGLEGYPALQAYADRLRARPALKRSFAD